MHEQASPQGYDSLSKLLHWLTVALVVVQFSIAWTMPDMHRDTRPVGLIGWHLSVGLLILLVLVARIAWRLTHRAPVFPEHYPRWQQLAASTIHYSLYAILIVLPLLGWGNANSRGWEVSLFGAVPMPTLLLKGSDFGHELGDIHSALAIVLLVAIGLHVAAALYHHFILKDRVLSRMLPASKHPSRLLP